MSKKEIIKSIIKVIVELAVFILLILLILYLVKSDQGVLTSIKEGNAGEKLDTAIKIFTATENMELETALKGIDGLENLEINRETGEYNLRIDGQEFLVFSKEIDPEEEAQIEEIGQGEKNGEENKN